MRGTAAIARAQRGDRGEVAAGGVAGDGEPRRVGAELAPHARRTSAVAA